MTSDFFSELFVDIENTSTKDLEAHLIASGAATFRCSDPANIRRWASQLGSPYRHPHADDDDVTTIETRSSNAPLGRRAFTNSGLYPHTDRSVLARPPGLLIFWCDEADADGGDTVLVDGKALLEDWAAERPDDVQTLMDPTHFIISADGKSVRRPLFERWGDAEYSIRFRNDEGIHCSAPAVGSFRQLLAEIDDRSLTFPLNPGAGYIVQNTRWLHGRLPFRGYRKCSRVLLSSFGSNERSFATFSTDANLAAADPA